MSGDAGEFGSRLTIAVTEAARTIEGSQYRQQTLATCAPRLQPAVLETPLAAWGAVDPHMTNQRGGTCLPTWTHWPPS